MYSPNNQQQASNERKLLFVGVVIEEKYLSTRGVGIYRTWGKEVPFLNFFSSPSDNEDFIHLPVIKLPDINDAQYSQQQMVYHMLKYIYDHYINEFDFFMWTQDNVYVRVDKLMELLKETNPAQDRYMGSPWFKQQEDQDRIQPMDVWHYCMSGPVVIFTHSALLKLSPHLDKCFKVQCMCVYT